MPILARPGQPAHLDAEDDADVIEADLGQEALEAEPAFRGPAAAPLVLVDDDHPVRRPAQGDGAASQVVLQCGRLAMLEHLLGGGLPHIDDRQPVEVAGPDLARPPGGLVDRPTGAVISRPGRLRGDLIDSHGAPPAPPGALAVAGPPAV